MRMQLRKGGLISPSNLTRIGYFGYRTCEILSSRARFTISRSILLPYATVVRRHLNLGQMLGQMFITLTATAVGLEEHCRLSKGVLVQLFRAF